MTRTLFLDTTIQIDRIFKERPPEKVAALRELLASFDFLVACSYSRLEFKRTIIQDLGFILNCLLEERSFFRTFQRFQSLGSFRDRRASRLTNILAWIGIRLDDEFVLGEGPDARLALQAESYIRTNLLILWKQFDKMVHSVTDGTQCLRAREGPRKMDSGKFDTAIPVSQCKTKECNNVNFFRANLPRFKKLCEVIEKLRTASDPMLTPELGRLLETIKAAMANPSRLYDYKACVGVGDAWLHLEATKAGVKDFATTNYKESRVLCPVFEITMRVPESKRQSS